MNCISCNTLNRPNAQFCIECGAYLVTKENCSACGKLNRTNSNFCIDCGSSLNKIGYTHKSIYSINEFINLLGAYNKEFPHVKFFILSLIAATFVILTAVQLDINYAYISNGFKGGIAYFENFSISSENKPDFHASVQKELFSNSSKNNNIVIQLPNSTRAIKDLFGISASDGQFKTGKTAMTSIWFEQSFQHGNDSLHVVFLKTQSLDESGEVDGHRASAPLISAASYKKANNDWLLISKQINFTTIGQFGEAPEIKDAEITRLSEDKIVFFIDFGYSNNGYTESGKVLIIYNNYNWKNVGFIITDSDNSGTCGPDLSPCYQFSGEISFSSEKKDFPDVLVTKAGSELSNNQKVVVAGIDTYVFDGNKYEEVQNNNSNTSEEYNGNQHVKNMLDGSANHDEQKILDNKLVLEQRVKPPQGDKKNARKTNDDALVLLRNNQFEDAVKLFEEAHNLDLSDVEIADNFGYALLKSNNLTRAREVLDQTISMSPGRATSWASLGQVFALQSDLTNAIASYSNAFRFSKNRIKTLTWFKELNQTETSNTVQQARTATIEWADKTFQDLHSQPTQSLEVAQKVKQPKDQMKSSTQLLEGSHSSQVCIKRVILKTCQVNEQRRCESSEDGPACWRLSLQQRINLCFLNLLQAVDKEGPGTSGRTNRGSLTDFLNWHLSEDLFNAVRECQQESINQKIESSQQVNPAVELASKTQDNVKPSDNLSSYIQAIANKVSNSWIQSPYYTRGLKCSLQVKLLPSGEVENAVVTQSSGDMTFDRSAENAVRKASPLPIPNDKELFNQNFRTFTFEFSPG